MRFGHCPRTAAVSAAQAVRPPERACGVQGAARPRPRGPEAPEWPTLRTGHAVSRRDGGAPAGWHSGAVPRCARKLSDWGMILDSAEAIFNPNSEMRMRSARGPRAGLGGSPKPSCPSSNFLLRAKKLVERGFRRAAENGTPAACAPRAAALRATFGVRADEPRAGDLIAPEGHRRKIVDANLPRVFPPAPLRGNRTKGLRVRGLRSCLAGPRLISGGVPPGQLNPNSEMGTGSARGSRAGLGGPPKPACPRSNFLLGSKKLVVRGFRRAAENCTPAACAPRAAPPRTIPTAESSG